MKAEEILNSTVDDLLFSDRNRNYGAYDIRVWYTKNLRNSSLIALGIVVLFAVWTIISAYLDKRKADEIPDVVSTANLTEPPPTTKTPPPPEVKIPVPESIKFVPPKIVEKVTKEEKIATMDEIKNIQNVSTETHEGTKETVTEVKEEVKKEVVEEEKPLLFVQNMPEFPGGEDAMQKFISKNLVYPSLALDLGLEGKVYVQFVVKKDGSINDVTVLKDIGGGCGVAATKVVSKMPSWKAGSQSGRNVPVLVRIPIQFKINK
ncbi:MAG: energy transducer TonB [Bacteroidetes bacterium]|nr:energy transducer TonB [Bacteroidota bacterium]